MAFIVVAKPPLPYSAPPRRRVSFPLGLLLCRRVGMFVATCLVANVAAVAGEFDLPSFDEGKIRAAGIRMLVGKHIAIYTDLPAGAEIEELPRVFDAAVPHWCSYFGVDPAKVAGWKIVGCVVEQKARFQGAGLYPENLPEFPHGYSRGSQLWLYDQPSGYYRRHLLLHEGTHCFMQRWLGGAGPPWYMEGIAELLATHQWQASQLKLKVMPRSKEDVPYWGRVKIVKDELAAGRGMSLLDILRYDSRAHLRTEPYGWCWAAAEFFDEHPLTQQAFRELKSDAGDWTHDFSRRFYGRLKDRWSEISEDWQLFVGDIDYGYDVGRAAVVRKPAVLLPAAGSKITLVTDRGWQSTGLRLEAGREYRLSASGRYQIAGGSEPWPCEAGGVTIRYHDDRPLGVLLATVSDLEGEPPAQTPLAETQAVGLSRSIKPERAGTLYLKINEPASGLADNTGTLTVQVKATR